MGREPFAARLYFVPRALRGPQNALLRGLRGYFEHAPGWVILTTKGRESGRPREVLLPCERSSELAVVISTYGWRAHWIRNLRNEPRVRFTAGGLVLRGRAEIVEDPARKLSIIRENPFFPAAPFLVVHAVLRTLLRPLLQLFLRYWVRPRPVVVIRPLGIAVSHSEPEW
jgi:deazaflavin-dependent oxidoreductase (nitroreductase family)